MNTTRALIRLPDHDVSVLINDQGLITLFKYSEETNQCDFEIFDSLQSVTASEWVHEPLPRVTYSIKTPDGEQLL
jgi:hypothetical protein